jgi:hypothetical protein
MENQPVLTSLLTLCSTICLTLCSTLARHHLNQRETAAVDSYTTDLCTTTAVHYARYYFTAS